ncbi:hypothetical protein BMF94_6450 [Rhodotorula taiwanensis]|uniref:Prefoldin, alpha subunit n=1 Tax=Rhodotorula taiwanensis TaxID=741276 RepID=A0A2S5B198_9BASI|nr:hypothetical protein BMF94_6450 [Rhodotorula taiwanensis]
MAGAAPPPGSVSLQDLSLDQISQVRSQLEQELKHLTAAFGDLKQAQSKFMACIDSLDSIKPANKGTPAPPLGSTCISRLTSPEAHKTILIPLTSSLYVPGRIQDADNVLVDIGTGYFVEKETKQAKTLYNAKVLALKSNLATLQQQIETKQSNFEACTQMMRVKMAQQQQQQQGAGPGAAGASDD